MILETYCDIYVSVLKEDPPFLTSEEYSFLLMLLWIPKNSILQTFLHVNNIIENSEATTHGSKSLSEMVVFINQNVPRTYLYPDLSLYLGHCLEQFFVNPLYHQNVCVHVKLLFPPVLYCVMDVAECSLINMSRLFLLHV
ncbi:synaptogyrin-3 [Platysternon megacephalum]|uniref:Synaptogyrin-3 n=1 Tax=Platysternon megacephalum TaxID=55544 RepID=A0A4D9EUR1_9SAUR|nr:synaptogyrin-3 [Platysternon megacephalum]